MDCQQQQQKKMYTSRIKHVHIDSPVGDIIPIQFYFPPEATVYERYDGWILHWFQHLIMKIIVVTENKTRDLLLY